MQKKVGGGQPARTRQSGELGGLEFITSVSGGMGMDDASAEARVPGTSRGNHMDSWTCVRRS